ncbi:MAG: hypothetical protein ACK56I_07415, partial [bacterium]
AYERSNFKLDFYDSLNPEEPSLFEKDYSAFRQYGISKIGNIYFTQYLYEYINTKKLNIKTASLHPGVIHTELGRDFKSIFIQVAFTMIYPLFWLFTKTRYYGAQTTLHLCFINDDEFVNGGYYS